MIVVCIADAVFAVWILVANCAHLSPSIPEMEGKYAHGASFFEDVTLVEFMYPAFTHMPEGVTVGDQAAAVVSLVR